MNKKFIMLIVLIIFSMMGCSYKQKITFENEISIGNKIAYTEENTKEKESDEGEIIINEDDYILADDNGYFDWDNAQAKFINLQSAKKLNKNNDIKVIKIENESYNSVKYIKGAIKKIKHTFYDKYEIYLTNGTADYNVIITGDYSQVEKYNVGDEVELYVSLRNIDSGIFHDLINLNFKLKENE